MLETPDPVQTLHAPSNCLPKSYFVLSLYWLKEMVKELGGIVDLLFYMKWGGKGEGAGYEAVIRDQTKTK